MSRRKKRIHNIIMRASLRHDVSPTLVAAVIWTESRGKSLAARYEDGFYRRYLAHLSREELPGYVPPAYVCTLDTEKRLRACSFGLMQIMGETAREQGFKRPYLFALLRPKHNIEIGVKYLAHCMRRGGNDVRAALLRYNGGGDPDYPDRVIQARASENYKRVFE